MTDGYCDGTCLQCEQCEDKVMHDFRELTDANKQSVKCFMTKTLDTKCHPITHAFNMPVVFPPVQNISAIPELKTSETSEDPRAKDPEYLRCETCHEFMANVTKNPCKCGLYYCKGCSLVWDGNAQCYCGIVWN